ncbi:MAG: hypothetical protein ABIL76_00995 [candidate division WOR-3 bacterium]
MLWIILQVEIKSFVGDTIPFDSKVLKVIPSDKADILGNKIIAKAPGRIIVITEKGKTSVFIRKTKRIKLPYDSLVLNVGDSLFLNFGNYQYEIKPKFIGFIKNNKLYITNPGNGILIAKSDEGFGIIKIISIRKNKKQVNLSLPNKVVMEKDERKVFIGYKISSSSDKVKITSDTIVALNYGIARVFFSYEDDTIYGYKNVIFIIKPKVMEIIGKPGDKIKVEGKNVKILNSVGSVKLENNYLTCNDKCFGLLEVDERKVPFLFHRDAYKEDDDKDFIIIRNSMQIPKSFEIIEVFPRKNLEISNSEIKVREKGLSFSIVRTKRGITIIKIISIKGND